VAAELGVEDPNANENQNRKVISQNKEKLNMGIFELIYFGFMLFEP
jgi:hypothetical protein